MPLRSDVRHQCIQDITQQRVVEQEPMAFVLHRLQCTQRSDEFAVGALNLARQLRESDSLGVRREYGIHVVVAIHAIRAGSRS